MKKWCWHRWDIEKRVYDTVRYAWVYRTTKTCRKCGEVRVKDSIR